MTDFRPLRILYLGDQNPATTSSHRCEALRRLGHHVDTFDPSKTIKWTKWSVIFHYRTGYLLAARTVLRALKAWLAERAERWDVLWVDNGALVSRATLRFLRLRCDRLVSYNCDDPTGSRDGNRWLTFRRSIPEYDLCTVVRQESADEYPRWGARKVLRVWMSADEVAHRPREITPEIRAKWSSEVAFIGTWMPERGPFMVELIRAGIPLSIWGNRWQKDPQWDLIKPYWRGGALEGDNYAYAIQCAKLNLGLLSLGNRDRHTQRSMEVPYLGGVLFAKKTDEHIFLYEEDKEALFWRDAKECISKSTFILSQSEIMHEISLRGRLRSIANRNLNEAVVSVMLFALK